jgi:uncharacterized protein
MFNKFAAPLIVVFALACAGPVLADALPTEHQVYEAARTGHLTEAERMIDQVVRERPQSAKAHWVAAEVYARAGDVARARQELSRAEQLEPGLPFVKNPEAVRALKRELSQGSGSVHLLPGSAPARSSFPWVPILIVVLVVGVLWAVLRRRSAPAAYPQYAGASPGVGSGPVGTPGVGVPGAGPVVGGGSGLMGSLATGLAVGAGVAAGEELVRHALEPERHEGYVPPPKNENPDADNSDMGGADFGVSDPSSWDDNSGGSFGGDGGGGDDWT